MPPSRKVPGVGEADVAIAAECALLKEEYKRYLRTDNWMYESVLPEVIEQFLPLRISYRDYLSEHFMRSFKLRDRSEPECRFSGDREGCLCVPRFFTPITSFPTRINSTWYSIRLSKESGVKGMLRSISSLKGLRSRWYFKHATLENIDCSNPGMQRLMQCYQSHPIHAFTSIAKWEMPSHATAPDIWTYIYDDLEYSTRKPGIFGTLHDNSIIDVRPYDSKDTSGSGSRDISARKTSEQWSGFIDCTYTAFSLEAGRMRSLVHGCRYRMMTERTLNQAQQIVEVMNSPEDDERREWLFHFQGKVFHTSWALILRSIQLWRSFRWHNAPGLHVFTRCKVASLHVSSGCVVKPIPHSYGSRRYDNVADACWVDSLCYNDDSMFRLLLGYERVDRYEASDNVRTILYLFPFFADDQPPRPCLGSIVSTQAMCKPRVELTSTMAPVRHYDPVIRTPLMHQLVSSLDKERPITIPGVPLLVVFCNSKLNYEDSVIVSESVNDMRLFEYDSVVYHPLPQKTRVMKPGDDITEGHGWFRPHCDAKVIREGVSKRMSRYVVASMSESNIRVGDKIATSHGQKFTVSKIAGEGDIPVFLCNESGRRVRPHLVIASSSIHNRGTMGQLYEAWAGMQCVGDIDFDPRCNDKWCIYDPFMCDQIPYKTFSCSIIDELGTAMSLDGRTISCDYGICHVWLLSHVCRDKQHYMSKIPKNVRPMKGKLRGSGVRFGEMECLSMMSGGLVNCLSYLSDTSDLVTVDICSRCRRLTLHCCCEGRCDLTTKICVRESLVRFDVLRTNYSLNGYLGSEGSLEEVTTVEGKHSSVPFIPESFVYET